MNISFAADEFSEKKSSVSQLSVPEEIKYPYKTIVFHIG
jgi:hypothetical protein